MAPQRPRALDQFKAKSQARLHQYAVVRLFHDVVVLNFMRKIIEIQIRVGPVFGKYTKMSTRASRKIESEADDTHPSYIHKRKEGHGKSTILRMHACT